MNHWKSDFVLLTPPLRIASIVLVILSNEPYFRGSG